MIEQIDTLRSIPYFSGLSDAELSEISKLVFEKTAARGEMIILEDDPAEALYLVVSGAAKAFKTSAEGKEQIVCIVRPGESFNDVPIFDGRPNAVSVQAMGHVILYGITMHDVETILSQYPQVALNTTKVLAQRVRHLLSLVEDLSFRHVIGRVAKILLDYAVDGSMSHPRLTQQDMAAMAGTAREVIGRSLKSLEDEGIIRFDRHRIVITNVEALRQMVDSSV